VLVADDNEATCTLITALLRNDFIVEIANDGNEAIAKLKGRRYGAILLDLLMPQADGYVVLDYLTAERPDLLRRVLVVTASLTSNEMRRLRTYPVRGIISKPFEVDALHSAVRQCAGDDDTSTMRGPLLTTGVIFLLADLLRRV
jgi:CheY-like chemotaxis protein